MRPLGTNVLRRSRATLICSALAVFLALPDAQAKTSRHRKRTAFSVVLQPFSLVHSVVHTVAAPVVYEAPRILRAVAISPIRAAYYKPRRIKPRVPRADRVDDYEQENERNHRASQPIRVAYQTARPAPALELLEESDYGYDKEQDSESLLRKN